MFNVNKSVLSFFAKNVRDAETEEEVEKIVNETNDALEEVAAENEPKKEEVVVENKETKDQDEKLDAILNALLDLTNAIKGNTTEEEIVETTDECGKEKVTAVDEEVEDGEEEGFVPVESNTFEKVVNDMKPILAKISNSNERKAVCDALAKSLGKVRKTSDAYKNIMQGTSKVMDTKDSNASLQSYYDGCNPHNK